MDLAPFYPPRPAESRKGDFGRVLVVGGSEVYAGAPAFNALAALRAGADLVHVLAPRRAADIVASYAPDLITIAVDGRWPEWADVEEHGAHADAMVIGGGIAGARTGRRPRSVGSAADVSSASDGIERSPRSHLALRAILGAWRKPMVIDAEALRALAHDPGLVAGKTALLTPHGGEFETLAGHKWPDDESAREEAARALAQRYGATVIVKGRNEVITDGRQVARDEEGSPFLTKGGYGDLLAGAAGALLARGHNAFDAARVAAFIVGRAGALAAAELGESTVASDALARFADAMRG